MSNLAFRIADTFTDSLARLSGDEQKAAKTTAFDLQINPAHPGLSFHKLERAKDVNFWSIRASRDIRLIIHKTNASLLLCYVGHHDNAYNWAERRKLETHPKTGAAQLIEIRETVKEIVVPNYVTEDQPAPSLPLLFTDKSEEELLGFGVPEEWLEDVRAANEDSLLELTDHLPAEAAEALLEIATGGVPQQIQPVPVNIDPFEHPDAQRRFRVMSNVDELKQALDYPWEKWTIFLHPTQREFVERDYNGPARVSGSAGTGKTIVALHRAVFLAKNNSDSRILLTTFSEALANSLRVKLRRLISSEPRLGERIEVLAMDQIGRRLYEAKLGKPKLVSRDLLSEMIKQESEKATDHRFSLHFLQTEFEQVVDAWQLETWEAYRDVLRLGRKTRLLEKQRAILWSIFEQVRLRLKNEGYLTISELFNRLANEVTKSKLSPFEYVVVDEAQDVSVTQLKFLSALGAERTDGLFFAGDLGQRIFQTPFSWRSLGVDIRGRSRTLCVNYRTSHQIRMQADKLLGPEVSDVDGNTEERRGTVSVFNGQSPTIQTFDSTEDEANAVGAWLAELANGDVQPHEVGIFVRSSSEIDRASAAADSSGVSYHVLDENVSATSGNMSICTMHLAKGLEFRAVVVMACDDEVIPSQDRIETVVDDSDLEEVYNTERHLLYVACTRARDYLFVSGLNPASEFLDDMLEVAVKR